MLDDLFPLLPARLRGPLWLGLEDPDYLKDTSHILQRYTHCILGDRLEIIGLKRPQSPTDLAAKRTVHHAMALCAAQRWLVKLENFSCLWKYPREHLYRAAADVAEEMDLEHWTELPYALDKEGVWPYWGKFIIEILGDTRPLVNHWPVPMYSGDLSETTWSPLQMPNHLPTLQIAVNTAPTRTNGIWVTHKRGEYRMEDAAYSPLDLLQRLWEIWQIREEERGYEQSLRVV